MLEDWECENYISDTKFNLLVHLTSHKSVCVSVSGGSDSDCIIHLLSKFPEFKDKIHYVFCNTGLEYRATLRHLDYLEKKYDIKIKRLTYKDGVTPIPLAIHQNGVPFVSKKVSDNINRLQKHNFKFESGNFKELDEKYPGCQSALKWWTNSWGSKSSFNIDQNRSLKQFIESEGLPFKVSSSCCELSKKRPLLKYEKYLKADLIISGERKSEGGIRSKSLKSCYGTRHDIDNYRPLFWWVNDVKAYYKEKENIKYSDCYEVYGLKRTGCVGCPFALRRAEELNILKQFEPNLYKAVMKVFGDSYNLTDKYYKFKRLQKDKANNRVRLF